MAVTGRSGGVSDGPWRGLNLGDHVGDDAAAVTGNRVRLAAAVGVPADRLLFVRQVHGSDVVVAEGPWTSGPPEADAVVTATPGLALAVLVADCVPVLLHAPAEGVLGVAHAGRRGMVDGVVTAAVDAMRALGATDVDAVIGPSICSRCYEVDERLREEVAAAVPVAAAVSRHGRPSLDVAAGVLEQLAATCRAVEQLPGCTAEDDDLFSYRRDGVTGRFAGLAWSGPLGDALDD
jgi:YfiH family protein